ncbi:MAG: hypothetical protein KAW89_07920 [Armatimonadetes bacterium]|nr:hypothetical protein [Armatimonadota bacterium]
MNHDSNAYSSLRGFLREKQARNVAETVACLFYYAEEFEKVGQGGEEFLKTMYRRSGQLTKPPDEPGQALRDGVNVYGYLERIERGVFKLSFEGRDFVENELPPAE